MKTGIGDEGSDNSGKRCLFSVEGSLVISDSPELTYTVKAADGLATDSCMGVMSQRS
ncbi:MAG: hypothetical protein ACLTSS_01310 [Phocaeicola coprocola]